MRTPIHWEPQPAAPRAFLEELLPYGLHPLVGQLLWSRGLTDLEKVEAFLYPDWSQLHDPLKLRDMDRAVDRIRRALQNGERVGVYGDFDTDGVTGVALLYQVLTDLGLDVVPRIPKRLTEGYGLHVEAVEELATKVSLLLTVDCGISNVAEIARAQALGMDVIVLDHHTPPAVLPDAYALINPKRPDCEYPYKMLAGVGVAYKLVQALHKAGIRSSFKGRQLLDIVAVGTVTDVAPLDGENRVLVKFGLDALNQTERPGLRALLEAAEVKGRVNCRTISMQIGPRINAAGRLDDAIRSYHLLLCDDLPIAREMASELNAINSRRQGLTSDLMERAVELARSTGKAESRIIVLDGADFPQGIVGLVAGKLVETFGRPVLLLERGEDLCRGSARSIAGFSIFDALVECGDLFTKYGGHAMAAGFSIVPANLPELEARLQSIALRDLGDALLAPALVYDAELPLRQHSLALVEQIGRLEPFGHGNREPLWVARDLRVVDARTIGKDHRHLKLRVNDGNGSFGEALFWNAGERLHEFSGKAHIDVAYALEADEWQGRRRLQMKIKHLRHTNGDLKR